uniref:Constans-like protein n=1 Tax=Phyllostachys edulis TaxID=38705 RepID=A0A3Q8AKZ9_PHYED|nr:constans-like protein [Phyllostachys edulis]
MCEVCELAPAAVTCKADAAVLCATCDADIHDANPLARRHARIPVAPIGSAAAAAEAMLFGTGEAEPEEKKANPAAAAEQQQQHEMNLNVDAKDMKLDYLFSDLHPYFNVEFAHFPHADSVVPNGAGAGSAVELDFTCGLGAKPSYSSYTATSLAHSVSFLAFVLRSISCLLGNSWINVLLCRAPRRRSAWCQRPSAAAAGASSSNSPGPSLKPACRTRRLLRATACRRWTWGWCQSGGRGRW